MRNMKNITVDGATFTVDINKVTCVGEVKRVSSMYNWFDRHILGLEDYVYWQLTFIVGGRYEILQGSQEEVWKARRILVGEETA